MRVDCDQVGVEFFEAAPTIHRARVEVEASPKRIFDLLLDADAWVTWAFPIIRVDWISGFPLAVGSTRDVHMRGGLVGHEEFIAYEHGVRMAFRFNQVSKKGIRAFAEDYQVTDLGSGRCAVAWTMAMDTGRAPGMMDRLTNPVMRTGLRFMLGRFAKLVESDFTPAQVQ